jgi:hypothetical protein
MAAGHKLAVPPIASPLARAMVPSLRAVAPRLVIVGILPVVAYAILRPHVASDGMALTAVMVIPLADVLTERARHKRFEPLGMIVLIGIAVGLVAAVALHGDTLMLKVRESLVTGVFGIICLVSLTARRPVTFYLARAFATGGNVNEVAQFNARWELPTVPARFRLTTLVWGIGLVGEAGLRIALALVLPTQTFLVFAQIINWTVLAALFWFTVIYSRASERQVTAIIAATNQPTA